MPQIKSSFILDAPQPLDIRDRMTKNQMSVTRINDIDEGHITFCIDDKKHYIFLPNEEPNSSTGYFKALTFQDALTVENKDDLLNFNESEIKQMPVGKLVYCEENNLIYYNCYPKYINNETGYFNLLVDLQSSNYINKNDQEWIDIKIDVVDLKNSGMVNYETVSDMKNESDENLKYMKPGQLSYCLETNHHYHLPEYYTDGVKQGYFGYFRTLCDEESIYPIIKQPSIYIKVEKNDKVYMERGWELYKRNGENILLITNESDIPNIEAVDSIINRGIIDYSNYPYYEGSERIISYTGTDDLTTDMYNTTDSIIYGDNNFYVSAKVSTGIPTPIDIDGIERLELKWDQTSPIRSNNIIVNKTKSWKASTSKTGLTVQPLLPWEDDMIGYAKLLPTAMTKQQIQIPQGRTLKGIYVNILGNWIDETDQYIQNGDIYTYKQPYGHRGEIEIKVVF